MQQEDGKIDIIPMWRWSTFGLLFHDGELDERKVSEKVFSKKLQLNMLYFQSQKDF